MTDDLCDDCWGSGWWTQFTEPCGTCDGTGRKPQPKPDQE